jgi:type III secretion protein SpaR/YscT/HrcT
MPPVGGETPTGDYVAFFVNSAIAIGDPQAALSLLFLFFGRMLPIIAMAPFFGSRVLPHPVKVCFAICLFAIFLPQLLLVMKHPLEFNLLLVFYLVKEMFIGFSIGFMMSIPFIIVQSAGIIIDHQRGGASLMVNDPTIQNQSSPVGTLLNQVFIVVFFLIDGPFLFIDVISKSYDLIPPDEFLNVNFFKSNAFWNLQISLLDEVWRLCAQFAAPALISMLMVDMFLGIANRLAPQVQITFLGIALKSWIGLGVFCVGWNLMVGQMNKEMYNSIQTVGNMVEMMKNPPEEENAPPPRFPAPLLK